MDIEEFYDADPRRRESDETESDGRRDRQERPEEAPEDVVALRDRGGVDDLRHPVLGVAQEGRRAEDRRREDGDEGQDSDRERDGVRAVQMHVLWSEAGCREREPEAEEHQRSRRERDPARRVAPLEPCDSREDPQAARRAARTEK